MTQPDTIDHTPNAGAEAPAPLARRGLFLVKPAPKSHTHPATEPNIARRSRSLGLLALAAAALAAPLLWFLHEVLVSGH